MAETLLDLGAVHQTWKKEVRSGRKLKIGDRVEFDVRLRGADQLRAALWART